MSGTQIFLCSTLASCWIIKYFTFNYWAQNSPSSVTYHIKDPFLEGPGQRQICNSHRSVIHGCPKFRMLALHVDFGWVFSTVTDSALSLIWYVLSLNWHSLSLTWPALSQCGLVAPVLCLHQYFWLILVIMFDFHDIFFSLICAEVQDLAWSSLIVQFFFEWHGSKPYWSAVRCEGSVHGIEVQVWLVTVAQVSFVKVWCSRYSSQTFAYRIVYLWAS